MTIKKLKEKIKDLPDDAPVLLVDYTTDDPYESCYGFDDGDVFIGDYVKEEDDLEPAGKALWFGFENKLNPNPLTIEK